MERCRCDIPSSLDTVVVQLGIWSDGDCLAYCVTDRVEEYRRRGRAAVRVWKDGGYVDRDLGGQVTGVIHAKASTSLVVVVGGTSVVRLDKEELVDSTVKDGELHNTAVLLTNRKKSVISNH